MRKFALLILFLAVLTPLISSNNIFRIPIQLDDDLFLPKVNLKQLSFTIDESLQNYAGTQYIANISLGTPHQDFTLIPSTDDCCVYVMAPNATCPDCQFMKTYNYSASYDSEFIGGCATLSKVHPGGGDFVNDSFVIDNYRVEKVQICSLTNLTTSTKDWHFDGFLGLQPPSAFFQRFYEEKILSKSSIGFYFTKVPFQPGSKLFVGGFDYTYNATEFEFFDVHKLNNGWLSYWSFDASNITFGSASFGGAVANIQTSQSYIGVSQGWMEQISNIAPDSINCLQILNYPSFNLIVNESQLTITPQMYYTVQKDGTCQRQIFAQEKFEDNTVFLGTPFLREHYVDLDATSNVIGIAKSKVV